MGLLDRIQDSFKYLDKNGLGKFMTLIKQYMDGDRHWTGTHAEYEVQKDSIPANTILHFTDDYEEGYGIVDKIEDNNMQAVTSNAVYDALAVKETTIQLQITNLEADNITLTLRRSGNVVSVHGLYQGMTTGTLKTDWVKVGDIPEGFKPRQRMYTYLEHAASELTTVMLCFYENGAIGQYHYNTNNVGYEKAVNLTYIVN